MKTWTKIWLFVMMFLFVFLFVSGPASSANPTMYTSLYPSPTIQDYGRASIVDSRGQCPIATLSIPGYLQYFRIFIPPGASLLDLEIYEWNGQNAIAHHKTPPSTDFGNTRNETSYSLAASTAVPQLFTGQAGTGRLVILSDAFASPYLRPADAGWFYVKVDSWLGSSSYFNSAVIKVDAAAYNTWYDHSGSNPGGSINWATDVEGVENYVAPGGRPGKPIATPTNNTVWTTGTTQTITAISTNATSIYGTYAVVEYNTTTGNELPPTDPSIPSATSNDPISANGSSVSKDLKGKPGFITMYKYRFIGVNAIGLSDESGVYSYTIDLRPITPGAVTATPSATFKTTSSNIAVTSANAEAIYYTMTTNGTDPPTPTATAGVANVSGPSNVVPLTGTSGEITTYKMKFMGYSANGGSSSISVTYTYIFDLTVSTPPPTPTGDPPGAASASPTSGSWTDASKAFTSVSAQGATNLIATYTKTTDGSTPTTPPDPTSYNTMLSASGSTVSFPIPTTPSKLTKVLMKFAGANSFGIGMATATCSYTIDLTGQGSTTPGAVAVNPTSGSWTSAGQTIAVSSANASQIEYAYNQTTDGTDPVDPSDPSTPTLNNPLLPSPTTNEIRGIISGASGNFNVPSTAGAITKIKIKFCGNNSTGYGASTSSYSYTTDLKTPVASYKYGDTITSSVAMASPGLNITSIITTAGILDPNAEFLKINSILSYSVADLVAEYLKAALNDSSLYVNTDANGVMTIGSPNFGGIVFTVITGSLVTTADSGYFKSTGTGNIEICTRNIIITLYPAGADEATFKQTLESYGLTVSFGVDHVMLVDSPGYLMAFRFQMYADASNLSGTGTSECLFTANANGYGTLVVTYPDGTKQNILPYVHEPEAFAALLAQNLMTCAIDPNNGKIWIYNSQGSVVWKGVPEFILYPSGVTLMNSQIQAMDEPAGLLFLTNIGTQVLFETY